MLYIIIYNRNIIFSWQKFGNGVEVRVTWNQQRHCTDRSKAVILLWFSMLLVINVCCGAASPYVRPKYSIRQRKLSSNLWERAVQHRNCMFSK